MTIHAPVSAADREGSLPEAPLHDDERTALVDRIPQAVLLALLGVVLLGLWQAAVTFELVSAFLLPSPRDTSTELVDVMRNLLDGGHVREALWVTLQEIVLAFVLASLIGFLCGVVVGETRTGERVVMPYLVAVNVVPKVAFAPLFVAWLGFGMESKVALAVFIGFFPMIVDTAAGLASADRGLLMLFRSLRSTRWQTLAKLKLPSAMPFVFAGLKSVAIFSVIGVIVGEYVGGGGVGELIRVSAGQLDIARVFSFAIILSVVGLVLFSLLGALERRLITWHEADTTMLGNGG